MYSGFPGIRASAIFFQPLKKEILLAIGNHAQAKRQSQAPHNDGLTWMWRRAGSPFNTSHCEIVTQQDYAGWNTLIADGVLKETRHGGMAQMPSLGGGDRPMVLQDRGRHSARSIRARIQANHHQALDNGRPHLGSRAC
jgi:hypothetical protein